MVQKNHKNDNKYVSCIKINGVPILPPLITTTKRKELNKYKQQAIKLENRLKREHELREYINRYYLPKLEESSGIFSESLEHKLSFDTNETLTNTIVASETPSSDRRRSKLSCDIQVSQYANNEFEVLTNFENQTTQIENIFDNTEAYDKNQSSASNSASDVSASEFPDEEHPKPRLIRSDSYVLETPSPLLLEHMKRTHEIDSELPNVPTKELGYITSTPNSSRNEKAKPEENFDAVNTTLRSEFFSETESELKNISDHSDCTQDDITVLSNDLQIKRDFVDNSPKELKANEEPAKCTESKINETNIDNISIKELSLDTYDEEKLKQILNDIPESYSKQILELLEKQKKEQIARLNSYMKLKESILETDDLKSNSFNSLHNSLPKQGKYCPTDPFVLSPNNLVLKNGSSDVDVMNCNNKICDLSPKIFTQQCETIVTKTTRCSRQLFAAHRKIYKEAISKQDWAASVIQAGARGYLVRRLLRTERVQGLIQTIKDALICAMELHSESSDNINESDVELHRRLIQQVSAACYAFNDIFFTTPVSEQMSLIRIDRERLKEKAKRPKSKLSLRSTSSRSSRNSR